MDALSRSNLILLITTVIIVLNIAVYVGAKLILTDSFVRLEQSSVEENIQRSVNALKNDLKALDIMCTDWSVWDDTYDFILNGNPRYLESNLAESTLIELHLDVMLFFDTEGKLVFGRAMDLEEEKEIEIPPDLLSEIARQHDLWHSPDETGNLKGIVRLTDGPMLVSAAAILTSQGEGPQRGILVMARWLDEKMLAELSERTALTLDIQPLSENKKTELLSYGDEATVSIDPEVPDIIWGYLPLNDIAGKPELLLSVKMPRDVFKHGTKTITFFLKSFFLVSVFAGFTLYLLLVRNKEKFDEAERRFRYVFENATDGLFVVEPGGGIKLMNSAAKAHLGLKRPVSRWDAVDGLVENSRFGELIRDGLAGQSKGPLDLAFDDLTLKKKRYLRAYIAPLQGKGKPLGAIVTIHNITKQKEADLLKDEFIATAAHELNTPLTSIMGYTELLLGEESFAEKQRNEFLSTILEGSEALEKIIDDLLDLGKMESGAEIVLEKGYYDLHDSLDILLASCRYESQRHQFENNLPADKVEIFADRQKINQVMQNLLSNAIKYSPSGGTITIHGRWTNDGLEICVEDQGLGMQDDHLERVFDKFYRSSNVSTIGGLGLGLRIAKNIIEEHGGRIWIESRLGQGTKVFFTLP